jgi:hypothetical protein
LVAIVASLPGYLWRASLGESGFKLKSIAQLVSAAKQSVGAQREIHVKALAEHVTISRHYHRLHLTFDQDLRRRLKNLQLVFLTHINKKTKTQILLQKLDSERFFNLILKDFFRI